MGKQKYIPAKKIEMSVVKLIILYSILFMCTAIMIVPLTVSTATASTSVSGNININTVWTKANSPYIVEENVQVLAGVKLTIEPGVEVKFFYDRGLYIDGELKAIGTQYEKITFTIYENQLIDRWTAIAFTDNSVDAVFDGNGEYLSGSAIINCLIEYGHINCVKSSPYIYNSIIKKSPDGYSTYGAINIEYCSNIHIYNNLITDNPDCGINLKFSNSAEIKNNIINNNYKGIGIYLYSTFGNGGINIDKNEIKQNSYGIYLNRVSNANTIYINNNNIIDNLNYSIAITRVPSYGIADIDASNNWWGVVDTNLIDSSILDYFDNVANNKIIYSPFNSGYIDIFSSTLNLPPQVNAGKDQIVFDTIVLDGSHTFDPDENDTLTYSWQVTSRSAPYNSQTVTGGSPTISNLQPGFYDVMLTVKDGSNATDTDTMMFAATGKAYTLAQYDQMVSDKNLTISSMFTQLQLNQAVSDAVVAKDAVIQTKDQVIATMFTQEQKDEAVHDAVIKFDINDDGKIGMEEAINALQVITNK